MGDGKFEEDVGLFDFDNHLIILSACFGGMISFLCSQAHNKKVDIASFGVASTACFTFTASSGVILAPFLRISAIAFLAIPYFSSANATILGLVATNQAIAPSHGNIVFPNATQDNCLIILPVFIE